MITSLYKFKFTDEEGNVCGGIAYGSIIICGYCGGVLEYDEVSNVTPLEWISISNEIIGE